MAEKKKKEKNKQQQILCTRFDRNLMHIAHPDAVMPSLIYIMPFGAAIFFSGVIRGANLKITLLSDGRRFELRTRKQALEILFDVHCLALCGIE